MAFEVPLLSRKQKKRNIWFGYLPLWSECVPLDRLTGKPDWPEVVANVGTGLLMGLREALGGIVSASLVFSSSDIPEISDMLPWGISMTLYTMSFAVLWYSIFGRLQYGFATQQDLIAILQAHMAANAAQLLQRDKQKIQATVMAIICTSSVLSGACSVLTGKLGLGKYMLLFPTPVINGFLGAIGAVVFRAALQTASGVKFQYFYPRDWAAFCSQNSLAQLSCMLGTVFFLRCGPSVIEWLCPNKPAVHKVSGLICQLSPLAIFYSAVACFGVSMTALADAGWTYPNQGSSGPFAIWTTYNLSDIEWNTVAAILPEMPAVILMSLMCTMIGALAITDKFPNGPRGDPAPMENLDFDTELATVGASSMILGFTGGNINFHKFSVIQLRLDGGTHRIAVLMIAVFAGGLLFSGIPIGQLVPKWYLAGLFMNTGIHFLKGAIMSYKSMAAYNWKGWKLPPPQYFIALACVIISIFKAPTTAIVIGVLISIALFLKNSSEASPVINVVSGDRVVSRTKRPFWENRVLRQAGDSILLIYLQGQLFFGSTHKLVAALGASAAEHQVKYVIVSLARVPQVDPSAARHLKTASGRLRERGCEVIFCRMNHEVFNTLSAANVVMSPDEDLIKHYQNLRWKVVPMSPQPSRRVTRNTEKLGSSSMSPESPIAMSPEPFVAPFKALSPEPWLEKNDFDRQLSPLTPKLVKESEKLPSRGRHLRQKDSQSIAKDSAAELGRSTETKRGFIDAFCHETDALDYCDERIVTEFCYSASNDSSSSTLEPYMINYRAAVNTSQRLEEWAFEDMNRLPRGLMQVLRNFCDVHVGLPAWTKVSDMEGLEGALYFILKGSVSVIQKVPLAENDASLLTNEVRGFSFREGKRLLKRYPPGHIAGKDGFFLKYSGQTVDSALDPKIIVSSKMGAPAEIWVLRHETWVTMPLDLKGPLTEVLCLQFADDEQHTRLQEH